MAQQLSTDSDDDPSALLIYLQRAGAIIQDEDHGGSDLLTYMSRQGAFAHAVPVPASDHVGQASTILAIDRLWTDATASERPIAVILKEV